jgi:ABC-2 type transport system permease protein
LSGARRLAHEFRFDQRIFWRNPAAVFFTVALPVLLLLLLCSVSSSHAGGTAGTGLIPVEVYVPAMITLGVAYAAFADLAIRLTLARERGTLKRVRGTPLPASFLVCGSMASAIVLAAVLVVLPTALGATIYGTPLPGQVWLLGAAVAVAVPSFAALGFALTIWIPSEAAAAPIANAVLLPLYFASGLFIDHDVLPPFLQRIGAAFPIRPLFELTTHAFASGPPGGEIVLDLVRIAAWGAAGTLVALWRFRWVPRGQG